MSRHGHDSGPDSADPDASPRARQRLETGRRQGRRAGGPVVLLLRAPIHLYRLILSPLLGPSCRFQPTCSEYALDALSKHGAVRGGWLALRRMARCHPWGGSGWDPVPEPAQGGGTNGSGTNGSGRTPGGLSSHSQGGGSDRPMAAGCCRPEF